jgi:hypothetical protein
MRYLYLLLLIYYGFQLNAQVKCDWAYIPTGNSFSNTISYNVNDRDGNIVQAGVILGSADMDPGQGPADTSFTKFTYNYYLSKTSVSGKLIWIKYFNSKINISKFEIKGLEVNSKNEIIVLGNFFGKVDFDLSDQGVDTLRSHFATYTDYFLAKYNKDGNLQWVFNIGDPTTSNIEAQALEVNSNDEILVSANPNGTVDVNPGKPINNSLGGNVNLICYSTDGDYLWNNNSGIKFSYGVNCQSVGSDAAGNVYQMSVGYYELTINKFDKNGTRIWNKTLGKFSSFSRVTPQSILIDKVNNHIYISGTFSDTTDFDPNNGVNIKIASSSQFEDGFIAKYDSDMNLIWVNSYAGNISFGNFGLKLNGNQLVAVGQLKGLVDFGNQLFLVTKLESSPFLIELNQDGIAQKGFVLNGSGTFNSIDFNINQSFTVSGYLVSSTDMEPGSGVLTLKPVNSKNFYGVYSNSSANLVSKVKVDLINVFPNPTSGSFQVNIKSDLINSVFYLTDQLGKVIEEGKILDQTTFINLDNQADGLYFFNIGNHTIKVIKN